MLLCAGAGRSGAAKQQAARAHQRGPGVEAQAAHSAGTAV